MRSKLIELFTRVISLNKKDNIYTNGDDNNYPERIERIINNSVTAKMAANKLATYIYGKGFKNNIQFKNNTLNDVLSSITESVKYHKGFFIHVKYKIGDDGKLVPTEPDILTYKYCRVSKDDDLGYKRPIYYAEEWKETKFTFSRKSKKAKWFYPYNKNQEVVLAQMKRDAEDKLKGIDDDIEKLKIMIENYRGQVYFVNFEPQYVYPLAYIDPAYNDADSEYRSSVYKNTLLRNGFMDKVIATVLKTKDKKEKEQIEDDIRDFLGVENAGGALIYYSELNADETDLVPVVKFDTVKSNTNDKLHAYTEDSVSNSILTSYSIHPALVKTNHKLFGSSGEEMIQIKKDFQNTTEMERQKIESVITELFGGDNKIIRLIQEAKEKTTNNSTDIDDETKKAQASLKGSVGGVQGILQIQQSYSEGKTNKESAITILTEIYGFNEDTANDLLGNPKIEPTTDE